MAEFALVLPILFLLAVAIGDFGRVYVSLVAGESAAREAADYGAFDDVTSSHFTTDPADPLADLTICTGPGGLYFRSTTVTEMKRRASAAVGDLADSTDPFFFACELEDHRADWDCVGQPDEITTCGWVVHVTVTFDFRTTLDFPPVPSTVNIVRDSRYAISALPAPT